MFVVSNEGAWESPEHKKLPHPCQRVKTVVVGVFVEPSTPSPPDCYDYDHDHDNDQEQNDKCTAVPISVNLC